MTKVSEHIDNVILLIKEIKKEEFNGTIIDLKNKYPDFYDEDFQFIEETTIELIKECDFDKLNVLISSMSTMCKIVNDDNVFINTFKKD